MMNFIKLFIKNSSNHVSKRIEPIYRVAEIKKNEKGIYKATIQVIGKKEIFKMKPEEILADDRLTELFHPFDIRLLTYLGYCGINTPQYKILAKKILSDESLQFALYDNKNDQVSYMNSDNIPTAEPTIISNMDSMDAYDLGFNHGRKSLILEKSLLKKSIQNNV
jgi:hypothetical protein